MGGIIDWSAIEDRLRKPYKPAAFDSPSDILTEAVKQYALPRQKDQAVYIEVWVEKDALSGVLRRITEKYHIPIMVNRGYSSASAMFDAFMRFVHRGAYEERPVKILYLGDFDPSGLDMIRDIYARISEFKDGYDDGSYVELMEFDIDHIALTYAQIETYNPPPNPAKLTDPRAKDFVREHGYTSWEVDALPPEVLNTLLEKAIIDLIDLGKYQTMLDREEEDREKLRGLEDYL